MFGGQEGRIVPPSEAMQARCCRLHGQGVDKTGGGLSDRSEQSRRAHGHAHRRRSGQGRRPRFQRSLAPGWHDGVHGDGALLRISRTYSHDLESFFYVLSGYAPVAVGQWLELQESRRRRLFFRSGIQKHSTTFHEASPAMWMRESEKSLILFWRGFHQHLTVSSLCARRWGFSPALQRTRRYCAVISFKNLRCFGREYSERG